MSWRCRACGELHDDLPFEPHAAGGQRPLIELQPAEHPLVAEQRDGITLARVQELAELLHP